MKDIKQKINEGKTVSYNCAFSDLYDDNSLPITCTITVDAKYAEDLSDFAKKEEGNIFIHFDDGEDVCY